MFWATTLCGVLRRSKPLARRMGEEEEDRIYYIAVSSNGNFHVEKRSRQFTRDSSLPEYLHLHFDGGLRGGAKILCHHPSLRNGRINERSW